MCYNTIKARATAHSPRSRCRVQYTERSVYHIGAAGMEPPKVPHRARRRLTAGTENSAETHNITGESREENTMMNYNYLETMQNDVLNYIAQNIDRAEYIGDRDSLESTLNDDLWTEDSVTGNASGSYFCNAYKAREAVIDNMDYCTESLREFCTEPETIAKHFLNEDWEYFDVTIRCYLLGQAISEVLDELENAGYFEENDSDESDIIAEVRESITA